MKQINIRKAIFIIIIVISTNLRGQNYSSVIQDSTINKFYNYTNPSKHYDNKRRKINYVCKNIGIWNESDLNKIIEKDSLLHNDLEFTLDRKDKKYFKKQYKGMNKRALWEFDLDKDREFCQYGSPVKYFIQFRVLPLVNCGFPCMVNPFNAFPAENAEGSHRYC